jgi:hypothetical protein
MIPPDIARVTKPAGQRVDLRHRKLEWESREINVGGKNLVILTLVDCKETRSRIHSREMVKGTEEITGRRRSKPFQHLYNHRLAVADIDAPKKYLETIRNESGVEVGEVRHRGEMFEG